MSPRSALLWAAAALDAARAAATRAHNCRCGTGAGVADEDDEDDDEDDVCDIILSTSASSTRP